MLTDHCVVQRAVLQRHLDHVAAGFFHRLLHGNRHFLGLALAHADTAIAIADHGQCGETQIRPPFTTLVTRLTAIIFSTQAVVALSALPLIFALLAFAMIHPIRLELQAMLHAPHQPAP